MGFQHSFRLNEKKIWLTFVLIIITTIPIILIQAFDEKNISYDQNHNDNQDIKSPINLKTASDLPNGRPLLGCQHATITQSLYSRSLPANVSYTLGKDWISKNTTIWFEGVNHEQDYAINGNFAEGTGNLPDDWSFETSDGTNFEDEYDNDGFVEIVVKNKQFDDQDYGYYEQTFNINEAFAKDKFIEFSTEYYYDTNKNPTPQDNPKAYLAIVVNNIEKNYTIDFDELAEDKWTRLSLIYDPLSINQQVPDNVYLRVGVIVDESITFGEDQYLKLDNVECNIWTGINQSDIITIYDNEFATNSSYTNTTFGKGYTFINAERNRTETSDVVFTISKNSIYFDDIEIQNITIISEAFKYFNTTDSGREGSIYTSGEEISWNTEFSIFIPYGYLNNWVEIEKPSDWNFTSIKDVYNEERLNECSGTSIGSTNLIIPSGILQGGLWRLEATSENYIENGNIAIWNGNQFVNNSDLSYGDKFQINITLDESIIPADTLMNFTVYYPNDTIFLDDNKILTTSNVRYGNITVGRNMSVGTYKTKVSWSNNQSNLYRDKVGYIELEFVVRHDTNLTAVESSIEIIAGDPLLVKVKYIDYDLNESIPFANVQYNSSFGLSGNMVYLGSGIYFADIDTSSLDLGDYYFSFSAKKEYYQIQYKFEFIQLKIIAEPLKLEIPKTTLTALGNSYFSCEINTTGALSGNFIYPTNISTDWNKDYEVLSHNNGSFTLNFSTSNLPESGVSEIYSIQIFANKTYYEPTSDFITVSIQPIQTLINVNQTFVEAYINEFFYLKVNFTEEINGQLIANSTCIVDWPSDTIVSTFSSEFIISFSTVGLQKETYSALISINKSGYETSFKSITVVIFDQATLLNISVNGESISENTLIDLYFKNPLNISARIYALGDKDYLTNADVIFISESYQKNLTESPATYFNTSIILDGSLFEAGINYVYITFNKDNYTSRTLSFQLFLRNQDVILNVSVNSESISENTLIDLYFKECLNISARIYALGDLEYLSNADVTFVSELFQKNLTESPATYFNISIILDGSVFKAGINYVYITFEKTNYTSKTLSFQLFMRNQNVNIKASINGEDLFEDRFIDLSFREFINISARIYALEEKIYLSGGNLTLITDKHEYYISETPLTYFNISILINDSYFNSGINNLYLSFHQNNYTSEILSFQLFLHKRQANLSVSIDSQLIAEDFQISKYFTQEVHLSIRITDNILSTYISNCNLSWMVENYSQAVNEASQTYYNYTILLTQSIFDPGLNYIQIIFEKESYEDYIYKFQINVKKLGYRPYPVNFDTSIITDIGKNPLMQIQLLDSLTNQPVENASVFYSWEYGIGEMTEGINGTYQARISVPLDLRGTFKIKISISKNEYYEIAEFSYILVISEPPSSNLGLWIFLFALILGLGVTSVLLVRNYYFIPKQKAREKEFQNKIQPFKDAINIIGINIIHKDTGLSLYSEKFAYLQKIDETLFSGFIHAIMLFGERVGMEKEKTDNREILNKDLKVVELDFKYFYILLTDYKELRVLLILRNPASEILKSNLIRAIKNIYFEVAYLIQDFDGILKPFKKIIPHILNQYLFLYYKHDFDITPERKYYNKMKYSDLINTMEIRILNVIEVYLQHHETFEFNDIIRLISEENEDLVIEAFISLTNKKMITPVLKNSEGF